MSSILIYGYGNPGRQDDGLGTALVEALEKWLAAAAPRPGLDLDANYQLNAEDALAVAGHDTVIFVDATADTAGAPFTFRPLVPAAAVSFSTHAMAPETVLALCQELYGKCPPAHLLAIRGQSWEPNAAMTPAAATNLAAALAFLKSYLGTTF